ncbi:LysR family transcriptional regulator [Marinibaculum pumilum]|uniref:LysR family transcriptional regulator n=1 Tax=Marinibaculum pumilum TaxID=1766165 RepID=A0ABV7L8J0_9PROT
MNRRDLDWDLYRTFLAVLRAGSLSAAARDLDIAQPTVARHIESLEAALGLQLFVRSPRGLLPSETALELRPYAEGLAATAAALLRTASGQGGEVRGTVRVSASEIVGVEVLPPILADLHRRHPALVIELALSNTVEDLLRREADIAVRMVEPAQGALVARKVGRIPLGLHAREDYLQRRGMPASLDDLAQHSLIGFDRPTPAIRSLVREVPGFDRVRFALRADSDLAQLAAIRAGFGIGACQLPLAARDPQLRPVLPDVFALELGVWVVCHENLRATPRCAAVFDGLVAGLATYVRNRGDL